MVPRGSDGDKVDGAATADRHHSHLRPVIESMIGEALTFCQTVPKKDGEKRNEGMQESFFHKPTVLGTRQSALGKTCAASAMEWSIQLEKGLRSSKPGVPVQAILQLGPRLQQWSSELESSITSDAISGVVPSEVRLFANAILLRLADAFRGGDREIKLSVVKVFLSEQKHRYIGKHKQCKGFLSKARVSNHLELLRRVKYVYDNGDSESKSLALVLFGCWFDFTNENAQIRYLILSSLVSPHHCEVRASLFAAGCFSETSDDFARVANWMLFDMLNSSKVPLPIKLDVTQVLPKFKRNFSVANKAYKVDFLLSFLNRERTPRVQETALTCLQFFAQKGLCQYPVESLSSIEKLGPQTSMFN